MFGLITTSERTALKLGLWFISCCPGVLFKFPKRQCLFSAQRPPHGLRARARSYNRSLGPFLLYSFPELDQVVGPWAFRGQGQGRGLATSKSRNSKQKYPEEFPCFCFVPPSVLDFGRTVKEWPPCGIGGHTVCRSLCMLLRGSVACPPTPVLVESSRALG